MVNAADSVRQVAPQGWRTYPFHLVPGDPDFEFPAAEGVHPDCQSDTWFIAGDLSAVHSERGFAFLTIFNKNRMPGPIIADFHTVALFDLDNGTYGTFTDYDMPPKNMEPGAVPKLASATGHLDMSYQSSAGTSEWRTRRDADGNLIPFTYDVVLVGLDQAGKEMELRLAVSPTRAPAPVGGSVYNGRFPCLGQQETFSYFQTGMAMTGSLRWGDVEEQVSGSSAHVDRQWFPLYAGGGGTDGDQRAMSHEWRTIHLDNGVDFVGWRQFDRHNRNALRPFTGATVTSSGTDAVPDCVEDVDVVTTSYVRWPDSVRQLIRPPVKGRYMPDRHRLSSATLGLELTAEPLVPAPAHGLPIEYMEGPCLFRGTMNGKPVSGFGIWERSLALYRDWELVEVLAAAVANRPNSQQLSDEVDELGALVEAGRTSDAADYLNSTLRPALAASPEALAVVDDLALALAT
jgi:predicted secreted hydrolase